MNNFNKINKNDIKYINEVTLNTNLIQTLNNTYIVKDISNLEYNNYLKVKNMSLPILLPLEIKKENNHTYFLYNYYENKEDMLSNYESMLNTVKVLFSKSSHIIPIPKITEFKYKKLAVISNDRFNMLEIKIRQQEMNPVKNDFSWIYLSKYHIILDLKYEIYKMIKRLKTETKDIEVGINHGYPTLTHFYNYKFIGYKYIKEGIIENDIYKIYLDMDSLDVNHFEIINKYIKTDIGKKYFKLMVMFSYLLMLDIENDLLICNKYLSLTTKISKFLTQFKDYK